VVLILFGLLVLLTVAGYLQQRAKIKALSEEVLTLQEKIDRLEKKERVNESLIRDLPGVNSSLEEKIKSLEETNNFLEKKVKELEEANNSLQNSLSNPKGNFSFWVIATAYTLAEGNGDGVTSIGVRPREGRTVAVDPRIIPYGSRVYIPGYGWRIAEDTGGVIKGNRIDLYFEERAAAQNFGRRKIRILVSR